MRYKSTTQAVALPPRHIVSKLTFAVLLLFSLLLMEISNSQQDLRGKMMTPVNDSVSPLLDVLSRPAEVLGVIEDWLGNFAHVYTENIRLRNDNATLLQWQKAAMQLEAENAALRDLLSYRSYEKLRFVTAKVISDRGGPLTRTALINAGVDMKIRSGQAVLNAEGLVGRVIETGAQSARVLLLTDINSRIPVISMKTREKSIAAGNNTDLLTMLYLPENSRIKVGEKIVTAGDGEVIPSGLEVGEVVSVENGRAVIRPYASQQRLEYVSVVDVK